MDKQLRRWLGGGVLGILVLGVLGGQILAPIISGHGTSGGDTAAITGQTLGTARNNLSAGVGISIAAGANLTVTQIGRWVIAGNSHSHVLTFTDSGGTSLGNCTVDASLGTPGSYQYCTLGSPVSITSGSTYFMISTEFNGQDQFYDSDTTVTVTGSFTINNAEFCSAVDGSANCVSPGSGGAAPRSYGPVNFKYH